MDRMTELARVARLYYVQDQSQREIADRLGISVATVSRTLAQAREQGVVTFQIHAGRESSTHELESAIEDRYSIDECRVADPGAPVFAGMAAELGTVLGRYVNEAAPVGVSWGTTLKGVGEHLGQISTEGPNVVPLLGAMGHQDTGVFPNAIARNFATALGGVNTLVNVPAVLDSPEVREALLKDSSFARIESLWAGLGVAVFSVSSLTPEASVHTTGLFSRSELQTLRDAGAVAALNFNFLDAVGQPVDTELGRRLVCAPIETVDAAPRRVLVAFGEEKVAALRAALAGNHATVLITDRSTAAALAAAPGG